MDFLLPFLLWISVACSHNQITRRLGVTIEKVIMICGLHITFSIVTPSHLESQLNDLVTGSHCRKGNCNIWTSYLHFLLWLPVAWSHNQITRRLGVTIEKVIVIYGLYITFSIVAPRRLESQSNQQATGNHNRKGNIWSLYYLFYCDSQSPGDLIVTPIDWGSQ